MKQRKNGKTELLSKELRALIRASETTWYSFFLFVSLFFSGKFHADVHSSLIPETI
jgi:hypothetical protein